MVKISRVLESIRKSKNPGKLRESRRTSSNRSRGWRSAIWRKRSTSTIDDSSDGSTRSHRPSLFSCFQKKRKKSTKRIVDRGNRGGNGRGGRQLLRLMSSFLKKKDSLGPSCAQETPDEGIDNALPGTSHPYVLNLGGINILVEELNDTDPTTTDSASNSHYETESITGDYDSLSTEPNALVASQTTEEEVSSDKIPPIEVMDIPNSVVPVDSESSFESAILSDEPLNSQSQSPVRQSINVRMEGGDDTLSKMEQSIAKIERISNQICYSNDEGWKSNVSIDSEDDKVNVLIKEANKLASIIVHMWKWLIIVFIVFFILLLL